MQINTALARIQTLNLGKEQDIRIDVLRLDLVHPIISGNKWYKLQYYLEDAQQNGYTEIASFGGAYSNHIVATACACKEAGLKSIGYIRGEEQLPLSHTLEDAKAFGMELQFVTRTDYQNKKQIIRNNSSKNRYWIPEGGYGFLGAKGASSILDRVPLERYTHLIAGVGSGTMIAGILNASLRHQKVIGISSQKNNLSLNDEVLQLADRDMHQRFNLLHDYHFGGFAKHPPILLEFMHQFWEAEAIPTDIVYTSKLFYAITNLLFKQYFKPGDSILAIHSGGLQGNLSLAEKSLPF